MTTTTGAPQRDALDTLTAVAPGTRVSVNGRLFTMGDGFEVFPAAGVGTFRVTDRTGRVRDLRVPARARVVVLG